MHIDIKEIERKARDKVDVFLTVESKVSKVDDMIGIELKFNERYTSENIETNIDKFDVLDTNIVSYIKRFLEGKINSVKREEIRMYIEEGIENSRKFNLYPYFFENYKDINTSNEKYLKETYIIFKKLERINNLSEWDDLIPKDIYNYWEYEYKTLKNGIKDIEKTYYAPLYSIILKAFIIKKFNKNKKELPQELLEFADKKILMVPNFTFCIILAWINKDKKALNFFGKIDNKLTAEEVIKELKNCTWDLCHTQFFYKDIITCYEGKYKINQNRFITFDNKYKEVLNFNKLEHILYFQNKGIANNFNINLDDFDIEYKQSNPRKEQPKDLSTELEKELKEKFIDIEKK